MHYIYYIWVIISTIISTPAPWLSQPAAWLVIKTLLSANITNKSASDDGKNNHLPEILASTSQHLTAGLLSVIIFWFLSVSGEDWFGTKKKHSSNLSHESPSFGQQWRYIMLWSVRSLRRNIEIKIKLSLWWRYVQLERHMNTLTKSTAAASVAISLNCQTFCLKSNFLQTDWQTQQS